MCERGQPGVILPPANGAAALPCLPAPRLVVPLPSVAPCPPMVAPGRPGSSSPWVPAASGTLLGQAASAARGDVPPQLPLARAGLAPPGFNPSSWCFSHYPLQYRIASTPNQVMALSASCQALAAVTAEDSSTCTGMGQPEPSFN